MTGEASSRSGVMLNVMKDQFGNYVVQKALEVRCAAPGWGPAASLASLSSYTLGLLWHPWAFAGWALVLA